MPKMTLREAISFGLTEALDNDSDVFLMGEDVGKFEGSYAVTKGFLDKYGKDRVRDTPISESAIVGSGIGAALIGLKPIIEIMTINFALLAIDQIVNHAAKLSYMSDGQLQVPIVIRTVTGGGAQLGATHSQNFENWFASVPGLTVVTPSDPYDALGLLRTSINSPNPVIFTEHATLYRTQGDVPKKPYSIPFGKAKIKKSGTDITLIAYSKSVHTALEAADLLALKGISTEVIDLRTLNPLDTETIVNSIKKTNRAIVIEETWKTGGFNGELIARIQENVFDSLDGPVGRINSDDVPSPYSGNLESSILPSANKIVDLAHDLYGI
ncbi:MAG: alpha-ketoacid dehydrogenase subunit beta [Chloroflexi bacterium]|nr:alpha-ketoacid dehydrogenase subunit beta [Chloroflexota bacterium]MCH2308316.1 alpha-ketoacid dehydrogenase subunit beta [SAR202 cluster bacterium]MQG05325.1 alpha-ketoacid dehydrogenase subunit beta [SAR202 cluster bacterium]|tara:strand:- start:13077 stop:14054 length:978 start_codon:yes stop_codon:yes gene_type:complete